MKILHINFSFTQGGIDNMMCDIMRWQVEMGNNVTLLIINNNVQDEVKSNIPNGVKTFFINRTPGSKNPWPLLKIQFLVNCVIRPDVIHAHNSKVASLLRRTPCPILLTVHDMSYSTDLYGCYDKIVAISDAVHQDVLNHSKGIDNKIVTICNGVDFSQVKTNSEVHNTDTFKIVVVGRLVLPKKGQDILINAMETLINAHGITNVHLDVIGSGESENELHQLTKELGLSNYITFLGSKNRHWVYEHLCDYNLAVIPSRMEGFGLTVVEAAAAGLPVLSSNIDGPKEVLSEGKYGFLFQSEDAEDLATKIEDIIKMDIVRLNQNINVTRDAMQKAYSVESMTRKYVALYKELQ